MRQAGWLGVAFSLVLVGCGSSNSEPGTGSESVSTQTPTVAASGRAGVQARLSDAGYVVTGRSPGTGNPPPSAALEVALAGGGKVRVLFYGSAADAIRAARPFSSLERSNPKQFALRRAGARLYVGTIQEPATLPMPTFNKIVSVAEG
jgi:hypothetical protein